MNKIKQKWKELVNTALSAWAAIEERMQLAKSKRLAKKWEKALVKQYDEDLPSTYYREWRKKAMDFVKESVKKWNNIDSRKMMLAQLNRIQDQAMKEWKTTSAEYVQPAKKKYEKLIKWHWISIRKFK